MTGHLTKPRKAKMRVRTAFFFTMLLVQVPLLSGCWSRIELESQAFVPDIAIDQGPSDTVQLTVRVIVPSALGGASGGGGGGDKQPTKTLSVQGRSIGEAFAMLNQVVEREPSFSHCEAVIFGSDIAKKGVIKYLRPLAQFREFRRTMFVFTAKGKASDVFKSTKPIIERSPTRYIENTMEKAARTGLMPRVQLQDFLGGNETPHVDAFTCLIGSNPKVEKEAKKEEKESKQSSAAGSVISVFGSNEQAIKNVPGKIKRSGGNPTETLGTALYKEDKMIGQLDGEETMLLQMVRGQFKRAILTINDPLQKGNYVSLITNPARQPDVTVSMSPDNMHPKINIKLSLEGDLFGVQSGSDFTVEQNRSQLEQEVEREVHSNLKDLTEHLRHDLKVDPMGIAEKTRSSFRTEQEFEDYDWHKAFDQADVTCSVKFSLRRVGVQGVPPGITEQ